MSSNTGICASTVEAIIIPLLTNPLNPGAPEIESAAMTKVIHVIGINFASPPMSVNFLFPVIYITDPIHIKSKALYKMWLKTWAIPPFTACAVPTPTPATMYPTWLTIW